jgi:arylsulfatase A-like enzyme
MEVEMGRKILFITTDMMRWDAMGYYGDPYAQTPNLDQLAAEGIRYDSARNQNPLCMPCRNSLITGQYPRTNGSWNNGIPLPHEVTTIANVLHDEAGYRTGLIGKAHWEPFSAPESMESDLGIHNRYGPLRGFDFAKLQAHGSVPFNSHYNIWLRKNYPEYADAYYQLLDLSGGHSQMIVEGGGETGALFVKDSPIPRELYQTDWTTDNAIRYIDSLDDEEDWFVWASYGDPHHAYDPPVEEDYINWKDIAPYDAFGESDEQRMAWLDDKPWHWREWYTGDHFISFEAIEGYSYRDNLKSDHVREIHQKIYNSNKLIDDGIGKMMKYLEDKGVLDDVDIFFTPDHGGMDGAYGTLLIGPSMTDHICRLPMIWKPAKNANVPAAVVNSPVGIIDLSPTFCQIAGVDVPEWMDGKPLPASNADGDSQGREYSFTQYESHTPDASIIMNSMFANGIKCVLYERSMTYEGTEGELYDLNEDPGELMNLWDDPKYAAVKADMIETIRKDLLARPMFHNHPIPGALI